MLKVVSSIISVTCFQIPGDTRSDCIKSSFINNKCNLYRIPRRKHIAPRTSRGNAFLSQYPVQSYRSPRCVRRTLADALTARAAPLPPNRSRLERRSVASFCRVRLFAACEVVLRRSAARRLAHAEVRRSHDTSVAPPPLRFAKLRRCRAARSRAAGLRACESVPGSVPSDETVD